MAVISAVPSNPVSGVSKNVWETLTEADTAASILPSGSHPVVASVQVTGTFGGGTIILEGSNDNTNWVALDDINGTAISLTADGGAAFSLPYLYLRPTASVAGTGRDVDITVVFRG